MASLAAVAAIVLLGSKRVAVETPLPDAEPVNSDATPEARALLHNLCRISGSFTLSGQQNFPEDLARCSEHVAELAGRYPMIFGQDFGFADFEGRRDRMITQAVHQHSEGAIVALTWHAPSPAKIDPASYDESVSVKLTDKQWAALLTPGSEIYNTWAAQVDEIASYLGQLKAAQVPVLFRPYHEINGRWFWWNGRPGEGGSLALYRQLHERFVKMHRLNNIIWVWNVNAPSAWVGPIARYYPGPEWADVLTMDNYGAFRRSYYEQMMALAGRKPIALAEVGALPALEVLEKQPRWAYFMIWRGFEVQANSPDKLRTIFHARTVLNRGDARLADPAAEAGSPPPTETA